MNKTLIYLLIFFVSCGSLILGSIYWRQAKRDNKISSVPVITQNTREPIAVVEKQVLPDMAIESLKQRTYEAGDFVIEEKLTNGSNYSQSIVSYQSEGLKIYGLLTVPLAEKPAEGFPAIIFVHGYIPPKEYSTIDNYPTYQAALARAGFVTFKPDLRGHGRSEGEAVNNHFSEKYVVDTMSAIAYLKAFDLVDANKIAYWGHSNGGEIGLRVAIISKDIKAYSLWAGVVGNYTDMFETYLDKIPFLKENDNILVEKYGKPSDGNEFWSLIEPFNFLNEIPAPIQLQHGGQDDSVPIELSLSLKKALERAGKSVEYFDYPNDDHNIGQNSSLAFRRTIEFYNKHLK
jgi:dipeptidyl aminopeptidase/acylaminoacyl peptidase